MDNDDNYSGIERRSGEERRDDSQWYSNKDLFERMEQMSNKFSEKVDGIELQLGGQIQGVQNEIRKYNNLNEKISLANQTAHETNDSITALSNRLNGQIGRCNEVQNLKKGRTDVAKMVRTWLPLIITVSLFIFYIADRYGG